MEVIHSCNRRLRAEVSAGIAVVVVHPRHTPRPNGSLVVFALSLPLDSRPVSPLVRLDVLEMAFHVTDGVELGAGATPE